MENEFNVALRAWPQGVYVARAGRLVYSSSTDDDLEGYDVEDLFRFWRTL